MTVRRSRVSGELAHRVGAAQAGVDAVDARETVFAPLEAVREDRIDLSARARGLIAAGLAVRAFVIERVEELRMRVQIGPGRWLVLESGFYGIVR